LNIDDSSLLYLSYALAFLGIVLVAVGLPIPELATSTRSLLNTQRRGIEDSLDNLGMNTYTANEFLLYMLAAAIGVFVVAWLMSDNLITATVFAIAAFFSYKALFVYLQQKRESDFEERFPMALDQLVSTSKAGLNLTQSLEEVAKYAPSPVSDELNRIVREQRLGTDIASALINSRARMHSHTLTLTVSALLINIKQGGNLPEAIEKISKSLKEIWRLEQKLFTASAEARKGAMVISAMPLVIFVLVVFMQPDMIDTLTGSLMGWGVLAISTILYVAGIAWMIKIIRVDI
jgi:tight adherence protein B